MSRAKHKSAIRAGQVFVAFTKKPVSARAGLATLIGGLLERIEFRSWVEKSLPFSETSNNSCGVYSKVLAPMLTVFTGGAGGKSAKRYSFNGGRWRGGLAGREAGLSPG
jgi:hypothetical protein